MSCSALGPAGSPKTSSPGGTSLNTALEPPTRARVRAQIEGSEVVLDSDAKVLGALVRLSARADERLRHQITLSLGEARVRGLLTPG